MAFLTSDETPVLFPDGPKEPAPGARLKPGWTARNVLAAGEAQGINNALVDIRSEIRDGTAPVLASGSTTRRTQADRFGETKNVKDYGAVGDGTTDDYAAIAACLTAANAHATTYGSAEVHFPPGTYLVNGASQLVVGSGVTVHGAGAASALKRGAGSTYFALLVNADYATNLVGNTNIAVRDLGFDADGANQVPAYQEHKHCLALIGTHNVSVTGCRFFGLSGDGIYISSTHSGAVKTNRPTNVRVQDCHFDGASNGRNGISVIDAEGVVMVGNTFKDVASDVMPGGIDLEPNLASQVVRNVVVSGNTFDNCKTGFIAYNNVGATCEGLVVSGNTVKGSRNGGAAIYADRFSSVVVANNTVLAADGGMGISLAQCHGAAVRGNLINGAGDNGIHLDTCNWAAIQGNAVQACDGHGINLTSCYGAAVSGNTLRGWNQAGSVNSCGIRGVSATYYAAITGNVIDGESRSGLIGIRAEGSADQWRGGQNTVVGVGQKYLLANTHYFSADIGSNTSAASSLTYSRASESVAEAQLRTALVNMRLVVDNTTA